MANARNEQLSNTRTMTTIHVRRVNAFKTFFPFSFLLVVRLIKTVKANVICIRRNPINQWTGEHASEQHAIHQVGGREAGLCEPDHEHNTSQPQRLLPRITP